jgi:ABC-type proline/glycine betaine transport system permease subunit
MGILEERGRISMKQGFKPLLFHTIHTVFVFISVVITVVLGPCFGIDNIDEYTCFFHHGEYTLLSYFYGIPFVLFLFLLVIAGSFHLVPYNIMYLVKYWRNSVSRSTMKGLGMSIIALLLITLHPFCTFSFADAINRNFEFWPEIFWAIIFITIIISVYYLPYAFIHLSYPNISHIPRYRVYKAALTSQLILYLILLIYVNSSFPVALSEYIDNTYLHWIHK